MFPILILMISINIVFPERGYIGELFFSLLEVIFIGVISWTLVATATIFEKYVYYRYDISDEDNLKARKIRTQFQYIKRIFIIAVLLIAISVTLLNFESVKNIGRGLLTSAGVAGIIIGFAAQKSIANLLAGFQIAFTQPIRIDDVLIVENEWGRVEEITLTYVVLRIWDKRRLIIPINFFIEKPFQNWTRVSADLLGTVFIYADYHLPVEEVRKELKRLLENNEMWDGQGWALQVTNATEKTIEIRAIVSTVDSPTAWELRCFIREKLIGFIRENYPDCLPRHRAIIDETPEKYSDQTK